MRYIYATLLLTFFVNSLQAQDPHFSQYFSSPLTLNPANTGNFNGQSRFAINYRNQWIGIGEPFITGTVSAETKLFKNKFGSGNSFAIGLTGLHDKTAGGFLTSSFLSPSVGYHIFLDQEEVHKLSIGFQATLANKKLDYMNMSFANQFSSFGFNLNLPNNQVFKSGSITYTDWNTGVMYSNQNESYSFYTGVSAYHLTSPNESFLGNEKNRLPLRATVHGGGSINIGLSGILMGSGLLNYQGKSSESLVGIAYGTQFNSGQKEIALFVGSWYRVNDAVIPYLGYMYNNFQLGISYDMTVSGLNTSQTRNKSFELSLIYQLSDRSDYKRLIQSCKF